ncbi:hypothetical protein AVEN_29736-1 [Araneus ventricosus]|uniref:Uncharacterized protein n=1 Tax=Araneus ventricosus TaxID=182803 RepID=A0A4Y2PAS4_ARAVE|nr:hypothetical protein AVEN_29736-1 [Araneus ventricosus]
MSLPASNAPALHSSQECTLAFDEQAHHPNLEDQARTGPCPKFPKQGGKSATPKFKITPPPTGKIRSRTRQPSGNAENPSIFASAVCSNSDVKQSMDNTDDVPVETPLKIPTRSQPPPGVSNNSKCSTILLCKYSSVTEIGVTHLLLHAFKMLCQPSLLPPTELT